MKSLKKILLSVFFATSMSAVSTSVIAGEPADSRIIYAPGDAVDLALAKIQIALDAITAGSDGPTVSKLIKDAIDAGKELNASDKIDMLKQRANGKLKAARVHAKAGALQEAEQELKDSKKNYTDIKGML